MKHEAASHMLRPRTAIFGKQVADAMQRPPPLVPPDLTCATLLDKIRAARATGAVVVDANLRPLGIVTEQDIVRRMTFRVAPESPVSAVMTHPVHTIEASDYLYQAIGRMLRLNVRHLPVTGEGGEIRGMLALKDSLADAAGRTLDHIRQLTWDNGLETIGQVRSAQARLAEELLDEELGVVAVQRLITHINNDVYARLARRRLKRMADAGLGDPPVECCLLVMGSGGRGENFLRPDQDHGLILGNYPDADHDRIDGWFREFSEGLIQDLEAVGFPRDSGSVMSLNPMWRKTLSQWKMQVNLWASRGGAMNIRLADIFFDFQPVFGNFAYARALREHIDALVLRSPMLLKVMVHEHEEQGVALGMFGGFITMGRDSEFRGHINLKHTGTLPLVSAIRLLALKHGISATGTLERMEALQAKGLLDNTEFESLQRAADFLSGLILRHQLDRWRHDENPDYYLHPASLSRPQRARLKRALRTIRGLRDRVRTEITGQVF
jgi:signal-transduction protein with cAMP-binding, CBS, and nucleotidyltransferase domain